MNGNPWIDPRIRDVKVASVKSYLLRHGWRIKPFPRPEVIFFELPAKRGGPIGQMFAVSEHFDDYLIGVEELIEKLNRIENRHPVKILNDLLNESPYVEANGAKVNGAAATSTTAKARPSREARR